MAEILGRYPGLRVGIRSGPPDSIATAAILAILHAAGADPAAVDTELVPRDGPGPVELRIGRDGS